MSWIFFFFISRLGYAGAEYPHEAREQAHQALYKQRTFDKIYMEAKVVIYR